MKAHWTEIDIKHWEQTARWEGVRLRVPKAGWDRALTSDQGKHLHSGAGIFVRGSYTGKHANGTVREERWVYVFYSNILLQLRVDELYHEAAVS